jgi:hypothetical protein
MAGLEIQPRAAFRILQISGRDIGFAGSAHAAGLRAVRNTIRLHSLL